MRVFLGNRYIGTLVAMKWVGGDTPWEIEALDDSGQTVIMEAKVFRVEAAGRLTVVEGRCCETALPGHVHE
jgi:hypothetical protein